MRRWVKVAVAAAAVLGIGGWIAEPYVQDWMLLRSACAGGLPGDAVRELAVHGSHFTEAESATHERLGSFSCSVSFEDEDGDSELLLRAEAYTRRDDQDREYRSLFDEEGFTPQAALPDGLPGFTDRFGSLQFLVPCPELGRDDDGRQRRMLVRTAFGRDAAAGQRAAYEAAVALVAAASDRLGCGAEPLDAPKGDAAPPDPEDDLRTVPFDKAADSTCARALNTVLPRPSEWRLADGLNAAAPTGRCDLLTGQDDENGEGELGMTFAAWYGDWSGRLVTYEGVPRSLTATARCDGETASFALSADKGIPGVGKVEQRELLEAFAQAQVRERDCTGLRVTG
ncbi:hypothetical protein ACIQ6Y_17895 [Streptomyces sp. NPDC096205]|uniref:hypothetical protein n=1 Tax=Streptomyces sp. NPDC096205 TaxID=3366081 RepID=UPI00382EA167